MSVGTLSTPDGRSRRRRRDALAAPIERYEHHEFVPEVIRWIWVPPAP